MGSKVRRLVAACITATAITGIAAGSAGAATINVPCGHSAALVAAVNSANSTAAADEIVLGNACTYNLTTAAAPGTGGNSTGLPIITQPLTITGNGSTIQRSGANNFRILFTNGPIPVTLSNVVVAGGRLTGAAQHGAGIASLGSVLTLDRVTVSGNSASGGSGAGASGGGGLVAIGGSVNISHSNFQFNAAVKGGAIWSAGSNLQARRSSFVVNGAFSTTGAMLVQGGSALVENSTVSFNTAANGIGGIALIDNGAGNSVTANVRSSTFTDNSTSSATGSAPGASLWAGVFTAGTTARFDVEDTIVTDTDSASAPVLAPCSTFNGGQIVNGGGNIEWPTNTCGFGTVANPRLGPIAAVQGTFSYPLQPTSPAIDLGGELCPATDQRGSTRPDGDGCDAGAVEADIPQTSATGPASPTNAPSVSFSSDQASATFECSVDNGSFSACTSPFEPTLSDGEHTVRVRAIGAGGYVDASPASVTFVVDTTAPVVEITTPGGATTDNTPEVEFTVDDGSAAVTCAVDGGTPVACASPFTPDPLSDGEHTITVTATDAATNTGSDSVTFDVDTTAPETTITSGPTGVFAAGNTTNDSTPTFEFEADEQATFECSVDGGAFASCSSPHTTQSLPDGQHTFAVRATDSVGNTDATPASVAFNIQPRCTLIRTIIRIGGTPIRVCLIEERAPATASASAAPSIASGNATLVRGGRTFARGTMDGDGATTLVPTRKVRAGRYTVKVTARSLSGRRLTGRTSVRVTRALAARLNRAR